MTAITSEYVKEELKKIAFLLKSNYQELLDKSHKNKIRNMLDDAPIDWNLDYSTVNNHKVKNKDDLEPEDWTQDRNFRDRLKNLTIEGKFKDSDTLVTVDIIWGESEGQNKFLISTKEPGGQWLKRGVEHSTSATAKLLQKLNSKAQDDSEEDFELQNMYNKIFRDKKKVIQDYLVQNFEMDYPWYVESRQPSKKFSLQFSLKGKEEEEIKRILDEVKQKNIGEKLAQYILSLAESEGFDKSNFMVTPSYKSENSFSILLRHS